MTLSDINNHITFLTAVDTNGFPAADRLISINKWYEYVATMIIESMGSWTFDDVSLGNTNNWPKSYNLTANTQTVDVDIVTNRILKINRVEVSYDGTNWYKAEPFNQGMTGDVISDTTKIAQNFNKTEPYYEFMGETIYLYPIPTANVTNGLKIYFTRNVTAFTSAQLTAGTAMPGFDEPFHPMISMGAAYDWVQARNPDNTAKLQTLKNDLLELEQRLKQHYGRKIEDQNVIMKSAYINYN